MTNGAGGGIRIAASVLSADLTRLAGQVEQVLAGGADWLHVDVMDGRFVPNLTFGANMITALRGLTDKPIDVHLMVVEPERYLESFTAAGASVFTFHPEATVHVQRLLAAARRQGVLAGLALNPGSPLQLAEEVVADLDLLLKPTSPRRTTRSAGRASCSRRMAPARSWQWMAGSLRTPLRPPTRRGPIRSWRATRSSRAAIPPVKSRTCGGAAW